MLHSKKIRFLSTGIYKQEFKKFLSIFFYTKIFVTWVPLPGNGDALP